MTLSNTAVPKYYAEFREKVIRGVIPVNREVGMEMQRIDSLIEDPNYFFDNDAVEGFIRFCETELTLTDGEPLKLLDTFKVWAEEIFGWYYFDERTYEIPDPNGRGTKFIRKRDKRRLILKQYLIVARGAAKSMYAACIQAYFLTVDTSTTHQVTSAPTMKQAEEVMSPIRTAITRAPGPLFRFLTAGSIRNTTGPKSDRQQLASTKKGVENFLTGSLLEIRPMSINKLQGLRPRVSTIDEWLSGDIREDVIGAVEQGAMKHPDYLIVAISSEGTVRNGAGDTVKLELAKILKGEYYAPHISIWHYKLDEIEEVGNPKMWPKAQPNIGITVQWEDYHRNVERAQQNPATRNDILAKLFGIPLEGLTYFFPYEETLPHPRRNFDGMLCTIGADLSQGDDFCAFTFLFPLSTGGFGVKTRSYISERTMHKLHSSARLKYQEFFEEGSLHVLDGNVLDMMEVYEDLDRHISQHRYGIRAIGYDPYNANEFMRRWEQDNGSYGVEKVIQGVKTESVPLGEIKILSEDRLLIFDELLMMFTMGNAVVIEDTNANRKLFKKRSDQKIDNVSALLDAYVAYKANKEAFE